MSTRRDFIRHSALATAAAAAGLVPPGVLRNAHVPAPALRHGPHAVPSAARAEADSAVDTGELSARGHARVLRLAWTLADLRWVTVNAMKSAFIPFDERLALIDDVIKPGFAVLIG